jgi:hypothetical protein
MSETSRPARWWELPEADQKQARQGTLAFVKGTTAAITCPACEQAWVVYNGNYFCDNWAFPYSGADGECEWALAHPATTQRDRAICDLIGIDYQ